MNSREKDLGDSNPSKDWVSCGPGESRRGGLERGLFALGLRIGPSPSPALYFQLCGFLIYLA